MYRILVIILAATACFFPQFKAGDAETEIGRAVSSGELIRLHIIANSDSQEDQKLKLRVRDALLAAYQEQLLELGGGDMSTLRGWVQANISNIEKTAAEAARVEGFEGSVKAEFQKTMFPERDYAGTRVPAGEYLAVRVLIGEAEGRNWWCVMFPPLCFPLMTSQEEAAVPGEYAYIEGAEGSMKLEGAETLESTEALVGSESGDPEVGKGVKEEEDSGDNTAPMVVFEAGEIRFTSTIARWLSRR